MGKEKRNCQNGKKKVFLKNNFCSAFNSLCKTTHINSWKYLIKRAEYGLRPLKNVSTSLSETLGGDTWKFHNACHKSIPDQYGSDKVLLKQWSLPTP